MQINLIIGILYIIYIIIFFLIAYCINTSVQLEPLFKHNLMYKLHSDNTATIYILDSTKELRYFTHCCTQEVAEDIISFYINYVPKYIETNDYKL